MTLDDSRSDTRDAGSQVFEGGTCGPQRTVAVAMSGGVDSSTVAALLKERGHNVIGFTMKVWSGDVASPHSRDSHLSHSAVDDARRVADVLGIPHYVIDLEAEFRELIVRDFCDQYSKGRTPNPCIACNSLVKFGLLLREAIQRGADRLATGHYARVRYDPATGRHSLLKGVDPQKDQTYVLYRLTQEQLSRLLFPLGYYDKQEVRSMARRFSLPVAARGESQEICFIPDRDYRSFLRRYCRKVGRSGDDQTRGGALGSHGAVVDTSGRVLGSHTGIQGFTIGQRKGLGVASDRRLYVVGLDARRNLVIVGDEHEIYSSELTASNCNWVSIESAQDGLRVEAKIRYSFAPTRATVRVESRDSDMVRVVFDEPVRAVTPGQAVVLYDGDVVLGGGVIEGALPDGARGRRREGDTGMVSNP